MDAEQRLEQLGATGAHQAGDAEDLAAMQRERDGPDGAGTGLLARRQGQVLDAQDLVADRRVRAREQVAQRTSDHHPDQVALFVSATGTVPMYCPSRSTVTRSAIANTSSNLCEM